MKLKTRLKTCVIPAVAGMTQVIQRACVLCALAFASLITATATAATFDDVAERIERNPVLRGTFTQEKQVEGFRNPLRSAGHFVLAVEQGVLWETLKPFPSEVALTQTRIASRQPDGSWRIEADATNQPGLAAINATFFALMAGNVAALSTRFEGEATLLPEGRWQLALTPKPGPLAQAFTALHIEGARFVEQVTLNDTQGDQTRIAFDGFNTEPATLTSDEAARFD